MSQCEATLVQARQGGSVELNCNLAPTSKEVSTPKLFPLHVVEWVRLGFDIPILIKFGVYAPRVHPKYRGKTCAGVPGGPVEGKNGCFNRCRFMGDGEPCEWNGATRNAVLGDQECGYGGGQDSVLLVC